MTQYFEYREEQMICFYEITLENKIVRTRYGQKGTDGTTNEKVFTDTNTAVQEYERLIEEKKEDSAFFFRLGDDYRL
ncbi:WGR domain-containing protein [Chitinophaga agri]|uniref:WGR domain-containing protein n=1 Tax=Chitinophaga agri TaxID=2703787 RepID=A0A6B9ZLQ5_9BACT|nr:WGR domain-containing protein [Chitinophaga agri]QHS63318.1 WGR domain-containing protein [Chitinophaga agri]